MTEMNQIVIIALFLASGLGKLESARLNKLAELLKGYLGEELDAKAKWNAKCTKTQHLENGGFEDYQTYRLYSCDRKPYTMNIPDDVKFECRENKTGYFKWKAVKYSNIELQNVKCEKQTEICPDPPAPSAEHRLDTIVRYQLQGRTKKGDVLQKPGYYAGDLVKYSCAEGYGVEPPSSSSYGVEPPSSNGMEPTGNESESYDYDYSDTSASIVDNVNMYLECDATGKWNGTEVGQIDLPVCREIRCDASEFENITHGQVVNYTTTYPYLGEMKVECDDGYMLVGGLDTAVCYEHTSFDTITLTCIETQCPRPEAPVNGRIVIDDKRRRFNSTVTFNCDDDRRYSLIGQPVWRCGADGKWDGQSCVTCQEKGSYCPAPCIPIGAKLVSSSDFSEGSEIVIQCKSESTDPITRKCLRNRQWSGDEVHCVNDDSFAVQNVGNTLKIAMQELGHRANKSHNATEGNSSLADGKTIEIGRKGGVHVSFLVDISQSITKKLFESTMAFINAIIPMLGISDSDHGTRLALYFFASNIHESFNHHRVEEGKVFTNYTEAMETISAIDRDSLLTDKGLGSGSSLANGLKEIWYHVGTPNTNANANEPQNVLILISDGRYNVGGNPSEEAKRLKDHDVEIYSIAVGKKDKHTTRKLMREMSSEAKTGETHFFSIDTPGTDLDHVIQQMISSDVIDCGTTKPHITKIADGKLSHDATALQHAWPWMAQIRTDDKAKKHICGGSLIDDRHILTAAHCFEKEKDVEVVLKRNTLAQKTGILTYTVTENSVFKHDKFNKEGQPKYNYDIAILRLPESVVADIEVHPVCLWNRTYAEQETQIMWDSLYEKGTFGVVTGWGRTKAGKNEELSPVLKQMQMVVKADKDCTENLDNDELARVDLEVMFCAGGQDAERQIIDTCKGDSGGPFVIRKPQTDTFIQTGIVSHGVRECRDKDTFGFYTKLTEDLLDWIKEKTKI